MSFNQVRDAPLRARQGLHDATTPPHRGGGERRRSTPATALRSAVALPRRYATRQDITLMSPNKEKTTAAPQGGTRLNITPQFCVCVRGVLVLRIVSFARRRTLSPQKVRKPLNNCLAKLRFSCFASVVAKQIFSEIEGIRKKSAPLGCSLYHCSSFFFLPSCQCIIFLSISKSI